MKSLTLDLMRKVFDRVLDKLTGRGSRTVPRVDELSPVVWSGY